jgi:hypothetical protein
MARLVPGKNGWVVVMFDHMKVVFLSVGLLVVLSGLSSVSSAVRHQQVPAKKVAVVSLQTVQSSVVTAAVFRSITIRY